MSTSNSMVAHKWAHEQAANGSNFKSDGSKLYSYSTLVGFNTGRGLVFLSSNNMSPSTGRQLSYAWRASMHLDIVMTPAFRYGSNGWGDFNEQAAFTAACEELNNHLASLAAAKMSVHLADRIERATNQGEHLIELSYRYGFTTPVFVSATARLAAATEYASKFAARRAEREFMALEKRRIADMVDYGEWLAGRATRCPDSYRTDRNGFHALTIRGDMVYTSGGAECPIDHARRAIGFWFSRLIEDTGPARVFTPWHRNGHTVRLGVFQLDSIDDHGNAYAGCHKFTAETLNRLFHALV